LPDGKVMRQAVSPARKAAGVPNTPRRSLVQGATNQELGFHMPVGRELGLINKNTQSD